MSRPVFALLVTGLLLAGNASASSFIASTDALVGSMINTVDATSDLTSSRDDKLILEARDDAARFVASQGELRGAHLEAALDRIRSQAPGLQASDMQLAEAILAR